MNSKSKDTLKILKTQKTWFNEEPDIKKLYLIYINTYYDEKLKLLCDVLWLYANEI